STSQQPRRSSSMETLPITVLVAAKNEAANLPTCLESLKSCARVFLLDSHSTDHSVAIAESLGAEVVQFSYPGGYPKKRQWALDHIPISTPWVLLLDADESLTPQLIDEIRVTVNNPQASDAYLICKGFHFLGRKFRFGGFSHSAIL